MAEISGVQKQPKLSPTQSYLHDDIIRAEIDMNKKCVLHSLENLTRNDPALQDDTRKLLLSTEKDIERSLEGSSHRTEEEVDSDLEKLGGLGDQLRQLSQDLDAVARKNREVLDTVWSEIKSSVDPTKTLKEYLHCIFKEGLTCNRILIILIVCYLLIREYVHLKCGGSSLSDSLTDFICCVIETVATEFVRNRVIPYIREHCHSCTEWIHSHWHVCLAVGTAAVVVSAGVFTYFNHR